MVYID